MSKKKIQDWQGKWDKLMLDHWGFEQYREMGELVGDFFKLLPPDSEYIGLPYQRMIAMGLRRAPAPWEYKLKVQQFIGMRSMQASAYLLQGGDKQKLLENINLFRWTKPKAGSNKKRKPKFVNVIIKARELDKPSGWKAAK